ncbi:DUF1275 domain-containing protein [Desulfuromonas sp. KJ2020]|uniref:YoaK family protein n=1 Tax=Desulfuromonas sp. KJ2020 TaxID=2919173 RepID=UPI0020A7913C|nr:YoaK family protein [Desulfuromonas sp. KJ2020]MCP3175576.1 DUF1275 domain-containing protein [Desulfuromonas sp. KJ2020]
MPYSLDQTKKNLYRERPWVFVFGALLASVAGFVNVVLLGIYHVPVSHMSGAVSRLAIDITTTNRGDLVGAFSIFAGFLAGAVLSGLIIGSTQVRPGRRYGITMMIEGAIIGAATFLLMAQLSIGIPLAAMACGLQNAMASSYYGLIIRTTHVSGMVTDIGVLIGQGLRYRHIEWWKLFLLTTLLGGFFSGGLIGGLAYAWVGIPALLLAAAGCASAGLGYFLWRRRHLADFQFDRPDFSSPKEMV